MAPSAAEAALQGRKQERRKRKKKTYPDGEKEARKANHVKKVIEGIAASPDVSFKKRYPTLKKKAMELRTLCGTEVTMVCFTHDGQVDTLPEDLNEVKQRIANYKKVANRFRQETNLLSFLESQRIRNLKGKSTSSSTGNYNEKLEGKILRLSEWLNGLSETKALDFLEPKLKDLKEKIELLRSVRKEKKKGIMQSFHNSIKDENNNKIPWVWEFNNSKHNSSASTSGSGIYGNCYCRSCKVEGDFVLTGVDNSNHIGSTSGGFGFGSLVPFPRQICSDYVGNFVGFPLTINSSTTGFDDGQVAEEKLGWNNTTKFCGDVLLNNLQASSLLNQEALPIAMWVPPQPLL